MNRGLLLLLTVLLLWAWRDWSHRDIQHPAGALVTELPRQTTLKSPVALQVEGFELTPRAGFELRARVLSTENYFWGAEADLSPIDLALGWGPMSNQAVLDRIDITQGNRWYFTRYELPAPLSDQQIIRNSSNMHIIPAEPWIKSELRELRRGDVVNLKGLLVDAGNAAGFTWRSSLSREDTGSGSCELFFVQSLVREARP